MRESRVSTIEQALHALERELAVGITIIDNNGVFRTNQGRGLLSAHFCSHRKNPVCDIGFCSACIEHCRHAINARGANTGKPFVSCCWKGVVELVIPLVWRGNHLGSLFAGAWRKPGGRGKPHLPKAWHKAYAALMPVQRGRMRKLESLLATFSQGMLMQLENLLHMEKSPTGVRAAIQRFIRFNYAAPVRLEDLASQLHLSVSRTSRVVHEIMGSPFRELLRHERMQAARVLLLTTDLPVYEVAAQVGMPDAYHFNRVFKETTGMPPGRFRSKKMISDQEGF